MRSLSITAAMTGILVLPLAAQDASPEAYWNGVYQSYWDQIAAVNDCAARPDFCAESIRQRCEELWFIRNQLFNNAGQCFKSPLGQTMFDNAECTTDNASLGSFHAEYVAHIRAEERVLKCAVDTSATVPLAIVNLADRLNAYPFFDGESGPSGCIGWTGDAFTLHTEPHADAPIVAKVLPGSNLASYLPSFSRPGAWWYYSLSDDSGLATEGWGAVEVFPLQGTWPCESNAG